MTLSATRAAVNGEHGPLLLPTSLTAPDGTVTLVIGDPGPASKALALVLGGRLPLSQGHVRWRGAGTPADLRRSVAIVDVPDISEPDPGLPIKVVLGEELALAGLPSRAPDIEAFLDARGAGDRLKDRWDTLAPAQHVRWLAEIASQRPGVEAVVLASPDRWGGDPHDWLRVAEDLAATGLIVVVVCTSNSVRLLGSADYYEVGAVR
ncbi:hypothetical protein [Arsenicicoccus piscis]|uniref:ABC transporter ATP-binding protein n=1 Tax=Arsenicicoccus piscis TaxID=673954 RepID=A0ABQ6HMB4_9MICO|nr:hypothetical protein [Arsenicicoccus piscis]GMA19127.1 ABC transporter ATP-binding protein [Arsenicicoccus piscis]